MIHILCVLICFFCSCSLIVEERRPSSADVDCSSDSALVLNHYAKSGWGEDRLNSVHFSRGLSRDFLEMLERKYPKALRDRVNHLALKINGHH
jgi:hypothetical protein